MTWLEDLRHERIYNYQTKEGTLLSGTIKVLSQIAGKELECASGESFSFEDADYEYAGFEPVQVKQEVTIPYEKNGRKAYCIRDKSGKKKYISESKMNYIKTGKVKRGYTKEYREHLVKKAIVSKISPEEELC